MRWLGHGRFQLVAKSSRSHLPSQPVIDPKVGDTTVPGSGMTAAAYQTDTGIDINNYGSNYNTVSQTAPHQVYVQSGFSVLENRGRAFDIDWGVKLVDQNGTSHQKTSASPPDPVRNWHTVWYDLNQYGYSSVTTYFAYSKIVTTYGYICYGEGAPALIGIQ